MAFVKGNSTPRICIIGAGFSGLCMAIKLKTTLNVDSFTIYEGCPEVGGTWYVNTYPGCACDVPSHLYSFSFAPKYDWPQAYSSQPDILGYLKEVTRKYDIYPHIQFQTRVQSMRWDERRFKWSATILDTKTNQVREEEFDLVINGTGKIRIPHYPKEYLHFKGPIVHSAEWDHSISLSGKRVGIIGTGASAVQIIAAIAPEVEHLTVFQRKAPYILYRMQLNYSDTAKWALSALPGLYKLSRNFYFLFHEMFFYATRHNTLVNKTGAKLASWYRRFSIDDPVLRKKTTPDYAFTCKRIIVSENYYSTLKRENVDLVTEKIEGIEGNCVKTEDGKKIELDVLVLATGYQPHDFFSPMKVYGKGGVDVLEEWKRERPRGYLGILSQEMPNFFTLLGPYTAIGHNSNVFNIECQVEWTISAIEAMMSKGAKSISITKKAEDEFMDYVDTIWKDTVWGNEQCGSWYLDAKGENTTLWPHNQIEFWKRCKTANEDLFAFDM